MATYLDPSTEIFAQVDLRTPGGNSIDFSGLTSLKMKLQLGAADELTLNMPAQTISLEWRSDMPIWQQGAVIKVLVGYDADRELIQNFEIVSTTVNYPDGTAGETLIIRAVSDLARAARNLEPRTFDGGSDFDVISEICNEFGWTNNVDRTALLNPSERLKESGKSDLDLLKRIAREARLGGPRLTRDNILIMPEPVVGELKFARGIPRKGGPWRRLHSLSMNRDGGHVKTRVAIIAFDPKTETFTQLEFEANEFGGDPRVVYEGAPSINELKNESTTQGLTLAVVEHRGHGKSERVDVLGTGRFLDETDATALARRWFELREKLSRWATASVDGHAGLQPYESVELDGNLAAMDRGTWLPITIDHDISSTGWISSCKVIRVVEEPIITPT